MKLPPRIALGTMHGKEAAIAPPLARLGIELVVPAGFDTDRFGTFTGEIARAGNMEDAARAKARAAIAATGLPVGIASEGAYGPNPAIPILPLGVEILLWRNEETGHEIIVRMSDDTPCFDSVLVHSPHEAVPFLERIGFPQTAVIVRPQGCETLPMAKGLQDSRAVAEAIIRAAMVSPDHSVLVQTDMRAHLNPRRMATIATLAERLAARLETPCPACDSPGWGVLRAEPGLPCGWCDGPTTLARGEVHGCTACGHEAFEARRDGLFSADPAHCANCNP
jgi:hypothetical protein